MGQLGPLLLQQLRIVVSQYWGCLISKHEVFPIWSCTGRWHPWRPIPSTQQLPSTQHQLNATSPRCESGIWVLVSAVHLIPNLNPPPHKPTLGFHAHRCFACDPLLLSHTTSEPTQKVNGFCIRVKINTRSLWTYHLHFCRQHGVGAGRHLSEAQAHASACSALEISRLRTFAVGSGWGIGTLSKSAVGAGAGCTRHGCR